MNIVERAVEIARPLIGQDPKQFNHFAFIFKRNKLLSIGQNSLSKTSPKPARFNKRAGNPNYIWPSIHAEIDAISKLWSKIYIGPKLMLVSIRLSKKGECMVSKPCPNCTAVLDSLNLPYYYHNVDLKIQRSY